MDLSLRRNYRTLSGDWSRSLAGANVLVTGATGYVGSRLVEVLIRECRCNVSATTTDFSRAVPLSHLPVNWIGADIRQSSWGDSLPSSIDYVVHCAYGSRGSQDERRATDVDGARNVVRFAAARGARGVIFLSTISVYPPVHDGIVGLASKTDPIDEYGSRKLAAEQEVRRAAEEAGVGWTVLRASAILGPNSPSYYDRVVREMESGEVVFLDRGLGLLNWVFLDDVVAALIGALDNDKAARAEAILSSPEPLTYIDYYGAVAAVTGGVLRPLFMDASENRRLMKRHRVPVLRTLMGAIDRAKLAPLMEYQIVRWLYRRSLMLRAGRSGNEAPRARQLRRELPSGVAGIPSEYVDFVRSRARFDGRRAIDLGLLTSYSKFELVMEAMAAQVAWEQSWQD